MEITKINAADLRAFIEENRGDVSEQEYTERYLDTVISGLKVNPGLYRTYGGYWAPLKRLLMARPDYPEEFGDSYDTELDKLFSFEADAMTVSAAYLEQQDNIASKMMTDNHFVYDVEGGENIELTLEDADMERLLFAERFAESL